MNLRIVSVFAAVLLVAACSNNETPPPATGGAGANAGSTMSAAVPGSKQDFQQNVGDRVFFEFNESNITPEGRATLQKQADWLKRYSNVTITVEGHCDDRGTREYNLALGNRRAAAVKRTLVALGVPGNRIAVISYGKERPIVVGDTEDAWRQNRVGISVIN
ncbi:MAG TPA: peptidoglycan-associated lipoprotein Pal [Stellaceae bacterium]|nr:peptidoglycan-associated lipoprotein Pal [Stellaceae bacterium]